MCMSLLIIPCYVERSHSFRVDRPVLLVRKAKRLRKETGDDRYWAPLERNTMSKGARIMHVLGRPFAILAKEPMLIAITLYMSVSITFVVTSSII